MANNNNNYYCYYNNTNNNKHFEDPKSFIEYGEWYGWYFMIYWIIWIIFTKIMMGRIQIKTSNIDRLSW